MAENGIHRDKKQLERVNNARNRVEDVTVEDVDSKTNNDRDLSNTVIPGTDPEVTWGELSDRTNESIDNLLKRYEKEWQSYKTPNEIIETIEADYDRLNSHGHNI